MSAKRTQAVLSVALTQIFVACAAHELLAAAPASSPVAAPAARVTAQKPTSQADADLMLKEARRAIEQGQLDEADKILTRIDSAHINYSVFHVGPTPASVRRELNRARKAVQPGTKPAAGAGIPGSKSLLPFARAGSTKSKATQDPFANREQPSDIAADLSASVEKAAVSPLPTVTTPPAPAAGLPSPGYLANDDQKRDLSDAKAGAEPAGSAVTNPYAVTSAPASGGRYPVTPASAEDNPFRAAQADAASGGSSSAATQNAAWSLPTAPLPPASNAQKTEVPLDSQIAQAAPPAIERLPATSATTNESPSRYAAPPRSEPRSRYDSQPAAEDASPASPTVQTVDTVPTGYRTEESRNPFSAAPLALPAASVDRTPPTSTPSTVQAEGSGAPTASTLTLQPAGETPRAAAAPPAYSPPSAQNSSTPNGSSLRIAQSVPPQSSATPPAEVPPTTELPQPLPPTATPPGESSEPPVVEATPPAKANGATLIDTADQNQQALARQLSAEVGRRQSEAQRILEQDPERANAILHEAQKLVKDSKLPESSQRELLTRIDMTLKKTESYSKQHGADIDLDKRNDAVLADINRDREMKLKMQQKIAEMIDEFNRLRDEQRYAEMEIIARRLNEMAPDDPVVQQTWQMAKFIRREMMNRSLADNKENSFWEQMNSVEESAVNPVAKDGEELVFDQKYWRDFAMNRKGTKDRTERRTERELEIERRLKTPVLLKYQDSPLSEVVDGLSELTGINIHLDPRGLSQEGVNTDAPITINLAKEISLKSALNLILEPLNLTYVVNDEVLKITSEQLRDGELSTKPYNVADLVTPIPNFVPSNNIGLQGLINEAQANAGQGKPGFAASGPTVLVNDRRGGQQSSSATDNILAQQFNAAPATGMPSSTVPIGAGPGGMGGAANADFDSLIDLIVSTVATDTWAENGGGTAEIRPFPTNLSLVISQTQAVHEEIADLLQQLRRLQDLQVTIEVRFIRLNDSFFERIGVDFDMDIDDEGVNQNNRFQFQPDNPIGRSNTVGLLQPAGINAFPNFTTDLDVPFRQGSFNLTQAVPFGGPFDPNGAANFGFAILSDIEAYFLIEAAQGDRRTNVLNAPKVTLFNGQQAFVADATQRPFVVGVIPVVGEFAAAQQPVIVVLNEGTMMTIQAVVSDDRRYVRMTIVPFFTQIGDVDEFTFEGAASTTSSSASSDDDDDGKNESSEESKEESRSGVTVQLPSFSFVSVVTTVSVPDGGTVLLGGIKRLSEGRNEFGVPLLSKVPYINRLFRNVSIGRETDSLMMMVTPRIIIQEEEEERLGIAVP